MTKQKIIWIVNQYNPPLIQRTRQIVLSELLERAGYKVYLFSGSYSHIFPEQLISGKEQFKEIEYDGAHFIVIRTKKYTGNVQRAVSALEFQNRIFRLKNMLPPPDIIISDFAGWFGNRFIWWKKHKHTRLIFDIMDLWPEDFIDYGFIKKDGLISKILYNMEYKSYKEADGIIFSFEGGKDYIREKHWDTEHGGKVDLSKIGYLNNGVDLDSFDQQKRNNILNDSDLDSSKFKVVYLGSIRKANDPELLVKVAKRLKTLNQTNIIILVYGDGDYKEIIEKEIQNEKLNNIIIKGRLDKDYAPNLLSRSDVNLFNFSDGKMRRFGVSPNKLFMYFASGRPVISTIRPNYDLVESRGCGLIAQHNAESVADTIIDMSKISKEKYNSFCENSRTVAKEFDYKKLVKVLIKQIEG